MKSFADKFLSDSDIEDIEVLVRKGNKSKRDKHHSSKGNSSEDKAQTHRQLQSFQTLNNTSSSQTHAKQNEHDTIDFKPQKHLSSNIQDKKKLTFKIVKLYHDFFLQQKSSTKAEEIIHIYKKKLCDQAIIVPTIFCWLNDWLAKQFANFIKNQIAQLSHLHKTTLKPKKKQQPVQKSKPQKDTTEANEPLSLKKSAIFEPPQSAMKKNHKRKLKTKQLQPDMFFSTDLDHGKSREDLYQKINQISMIKKNNIEQNNQLCEGLKKSKSKKRMSLQRAEMLFTIEGPDEKSIPKNTSKDIRRISINSYEISNLLPSKPQIAEEPLRKQTITNEQTQSSPINRQILIGAFYEKYLNLYKSLQQILPDLDIHYIKQIKRNDRKPQIKKRIKQISRVITRNQPLIKNSVEDYELAYFQRKRKHEKHLKNKKNRYNNNKNIETLQINNPQTEITTRHSSLDYSSSKVQNKIASEKKMNSNLFLKKEANDQSNLQRIYQRKRDEKQKQVFALSRPIKFEFNLPSLPQKQRNINARLKQHSKIVLIQSGRYKFLDTIESRDLTEMGNRKKKLSNYSIDMGEVTEKNHSSEASNQSYSSKKIAQFDKRSVSILEIITKKKKHIPEDFLYVPVKQEPKEVISIQAIESMRKSRNTRSIRDNEKAQKQFKEILQNLQTSDYGLISAWQKGSQTPQIN